MNELTKKIAYIVPSETMAVMVSGILRKEINAGRLDVMTTDVYRPLEEYRRLCSQGYGCIIARGGTYRDMHRVADTIPVVEEKIRTSDILFMLRRVQRETDGPIYVIIHGRTARRFEETPELFRLPVRVRRYANLAQLKEILDEIPESGATVLSSGLAASVTERQDLHMVELLNRDTTVLETVRNAKVWMRQAQENIQRVNVLQSILDNVDEGILIFDAEDQLHEINARALELLGLQRQGADGRNVREIIPDLPDRRPAGACNPESPRSFVRQVGERMLSFSLHPFDFFQGEERYIATLQDVTRIQAQEQAIRRTLAQKGLVAAWHFDDILTADPGMQRAIERARTVAHFAGSVLLCGENGTGKELFAQSIHNESERGKGPFVAVNCAALAESLLESELFGYVGGAFTGARKEGKAGMFEMAHHGTIFLDEINSMSLHLQAKILRVLEQQEVMRVGSDYVIPLDVRIIAASNVPLTEAVQSGAFRRDLFYRLNTFQINIPPLRERPADIPLLFRHYLSQYSGVPEEAVEVPKAFLRRLAAHSWNGNVREIRSTALRYHAFGGDTDSTDLLAYEDKPASLVDSDLHLDLHALQKTVEELVIAALEERQLSKSEIARAMGISRQALYKKLQKPE